MVVNVPLLIFGFVTLDIAVGLHRKDTWRPTLTFIGAALVFLALIF